MKKKKAQKIVNKIGKVFGKELTGSVLISPYGDNPNVQSVVSFAYGNGEGLARAIVYAMQRDKMLADLLTSAFYLYQAQRLGERDE